MADSDKEKVMVTEVAKESPPKPKPKSDVPVVKNCYTSALIIRGVEIASGESAPVPGLDRKHAHTALMIKSGTIEVS